MATATYRLPKDFEPAAQIKAKNKRHGPVDSPFLQRIKKISRDTGTHIALASYQSDQGLVREVSISYTKTHWQNL